MRAGSEERRMVLKMLHEGRITAHEADELLEALDRAGAQAEVDEESVPEDVGQPELDFGELGRGIRDAVKGLTEGLRKLSGRLPWEGDFGDWFDGAFEGARYSIEREIPIPLEAERSAVPLRLRSSSGDVTVEGDEDAKVTARARITVWAPDEPTARKAAEDVTFTAAISGGTLEIETVPPEHAERAPRRSVRFSVATSLRVPPATDLTVTATSGDVSATGLRGALRISSSSGDLLLRACGSSPLTASSTSGDIELELLDRPDVTAEITSSSGDVTIRIPAGARLRLEADSGSGEVTLRAPFRVEVAQRSRFAGVLNSPDGLVRVRSSSGDIRIETLGE